MQITQRQLQTTYQDNFKSNKKIDISDTGFKIFSQFEEDGMLLFIFSVIGMKYKTFVDIGANDCINSNCANFAVNFYWHGLFIDSDKNALDIGRHFYNKHPDPWSYKPVFVCEKIDRQNINPLIKNAGFEGPVDLLSIDIDGNDYWIWEAITVISPNVVIIEAKVEYGNPIIEVDEAVKPFLFNIFERLETEYRKGEQSNFEIISVYLLALFTELKRFYTPSVSVKKNTALMITQNFKDALSRHIYEKQKVTEYADFLSVSPNHLNKCVKATTGQSAQDLLNEMIVLEAKVLLKQTDMQISEIAYKLSQQNHSDFSRFFKAKTGMSPKEYKQKD